MKSTFTLRDLFWLVLVVAIVLGWWLDRSRLAQREFLAKENLCNYFRMKDGYWDELFERRFFSEKETKLQP